jgi:hypothetical protein
VVLTVGDNVGDCFQGPGHISKYGNIAKNSHKIAIKSEKDGRVVLTVGDDIRVVFRVQGTFPNMVIYPKIARKWRKIRRTYEWCTEHQALPSGFIPKGKYHLV